MTNFKRLIAFLLLLFFSSANSAFAFSELYYLKNVQTSEIQPIVDNYYSTYGFNIIKRNPYYGVAQTGNDYAVVVLQQSGNNMFYYYQSENNTKINKAILKEIKRRDIICEQSFNTNIISIYDNIANETVMTSGAVKQYSFEEPESIFTPPAQTQQIQQQNTLRGGVVQLAAGTKLQTYLQNAINTATAVKGDRVIAVLQQNLTYNGITVAPQGSIVEGTLSKARNATYGSRNGRVVISFNKIITPENKVYNISAEEIDFTVSNDGKLKESIKSAATSAAVGAIAGLLFALITDKNVGSSMAVGAGVGAGTSAVVSTAERGVDAEIPSFTELELTLTKPLSISVSY